VRPDEGAGGAGDAPGQVQVEEKILAEAAPCGDTVAGDDLT
jgi:hypothetical protein